MGKLSPNHILQRVRQALIRNREAPDGFRLESALLDLADALDQRFEQVEHMIQGFTE
jgi:hypothetical protein